MARKRSKASKASDKSPASIKEAVKTLERLGEKSLDVDRFFAAERPSLEVIRLSFYEPSDDATERLIVDPEHLDAVRTAVAPLGLRVNGNGQLLVGTPNRYLALIDDEYDTQLDLASTLFAKPEPGVEYEFVAAYRYTRGDKPRRYGKLVFKDANSLPESVWGRPEEHKWTRRISTELYPCLDRRDHPALMSVHSGGKRIELMRNAARPALGEKARLRVFECGPILLARPITLVKGVEVVPDVQVAVSEAGNGINPDEVIWDGSLMTVYEALTRFSGGEAVFTPEMTREEFNRGHRMVEREFHPDKLAQLQREGKEAEYNSKYILSSMRIGWIAQAEGLLMPRWEKTGQATTSVFEDADK